MTAAAIEPVAQEATLAALTARPLDPSCFDDAERALLAYADKLTLTPTAIAVDDVDQLRSRVTVPRLTEHHCGPFCRVHQTIDFVAELARLGLMSASRRAPRFPVRRCGAILSMFGQTRRRHHQSGLT
jgi:hypothetical protein